MAKFKKKKSEPTPEPENSKPKIGDDIGTPEIEKSTSVSDSSNDPPKDSPIDQVEKSAKDKELAKLFWMRIVLAISAGVIRLLFLKILKVKKEDGHQLDL